MKTGLPPKAIIESLRATDKEHECVCCRQLLPHSAFCRSRGNTRGFAYNCIECVTGGPADEVRMCTDGSRVRFIRVGLQWWWFGPTGMCRVPTKTCESCGVEFPGVWTRTKESKTRFCSRNCKFAAERLGRKITGTGYYTVYRPTHPLANKRGYVMEHRIIAEEVLGRFLLRDESVHHRNGDRLDNRPENLEVRCGWHPHGTDPADLVPWAREILARYGHLHPEEAKASE